MNADMDLDPLAEVVCVRSHHCTVTLLFPFHTVFFSRHSLFVAHAQGGRSYASDECFLNFNN